MTLLKNNALDLTITSRLLNLSFISHSWQKYNQKKYIRGHACPTQHYMGIYIKSFTKYKVTLSIQI